MFAVELVLYAVGTVFVIFMLVSERAVRAHNAASAMVSAPTGMLNRRGFSEACARVIDREAHGRRRPVTALIFDIDHFKAINDRFGHPAGDELLKLFSTVVSAICASATCRDGSAARSSPPCCRAAGGGRARRRARARGVRGCGHRRSRKARSTPPSAIGVAGGPAGTELEVLLAAADTALYQAKRGGRNRVEAAGRGAAVAGAAAAQDRGRGHHRVSGSSQSSHTA